MSTEILIGKFLFTFYEEYYQFTIAAKICEFFIIDHLLKEFDGFIFSEPPTLIKITFQKSVIFILPRSVIHFY